MPEVSSGTVAPLSRRAMGPGAGRISLPKPLTSFIGRERELAQAKRLLQELLPPEAILPRLEHSLGLLTGGYRGLPDRQQTLRGTIAWSHNLLIEGAKRLLAACSVFAGGLHPGVHRDGLRRRR